MHTIEIDFEVFQQITVRRSSEEVTPNDVIRDLLGLPISKPSDKHIAANDQKKPWTTKGVVFPSGTAFRSIYKGQTYSAVVEDGALILNEQTYSSPSSAAMSITGSSVNGWMFWECKMPGEQKWKTIKQHRKQ